jgi:hypothetical protein
LTVDSDPMSVDPSTEGPLLERWTFRCTQTFLDRCNAAALDCEMKPADWLRAVVYGALTMHEQREQQFIDPDPEWPDPEEPQVTTDVAPQPVDDDYAERVRAEGARIREAHMAEAVETDPVTREKVNPRECPHLPSDRRGSRCHACGATIGSGRRLGGRYVPPMR